MAEPWSWKRRVTPQQNRYPYNGARNPYAHQRGRGNQQRNSRRSRRWTNRRRNQFHQQTATSNNPNQHVPQPPPPPRPSWARGKVHPVDVLSDSYIHQPTPIPYNIPTKLQTTKPIVNRPIINTKILLFYCGYFRKIEITFNILIPKDIFNLIINFARSYIIFGIGKNSFSEFGLNHDKILNTSKWTRLYELESLIDDKRHIYPNYQSLIIKSLDNKIYVTGNNKYSRLGTDCANCSCIKQWTNINIKDISLISHGMHNSKHTLLQNKYRKIYASGYNYCGCFGIGTSFDDGILKEIDIGLWLPNNENITNIICNDTSSYFLTESKNVYKCGFHRYKNTLIPILIQKNIQKIATTKSDSRMLTVDGKVIGDGSYYISIDYFSLNDIKIIDIKCGMKHEIFLTDKYKVYTLGDNQFGQLGNGKQDSPGSNTYTTYPSGNVPYLVDVDVCIVDIECGGWHSMLLSKNNLLYVFGHNSFHQCSNRRVRIVILKPYLIDKIKEFNTQCLIKRIIGLEYETILIVDAVAY